MPLTVTQQLINQCYDVLMIKLNGQEVNKDTLVQIIFMAVAVTLGAMQSNTKHEYKVQLVTSILHKLIQEQVQDTNLKKSLDDIVDKTILGFMPQSSCCWC